MFTFFYNKIIEYGEVFEVSDKRGEEILKDTYKDKSVEKQLKADSTVKTAEKIKLKKQNKLI